MYSSMLQKTFLNILSNSAPDACTQILGKDNSELHGTAYFYEINLKHSHNTSFKGVLIEVEVFDLPDTTSDTNNFYAMHIHEYGDCSDSFKNTGNHYNPTNQPHPKHSGDLPPLLSNNGYAYTIFLTNKFTINEIIDKSLIIHSMPDDFTTQPSGNSGEKIGCGVISGACFF